MILTQNTVTKIADANPYRKYFCVQNLSGTSTDFVYILPGLNGAGVLKNNGIVVGGLGMFEMQNVQTVDAKGAWYAYTEATGVDIRVRGF